MDYTYVNTSLGNDITCDFILQYVFFMNKEGKLLSCDDAGYQFLNSINLGLFYAQIQSIKINSAITNTTIILENRSYNLKMVPTVLQQQFKSNTKPSNATDLDNSEYIIVLQDQTLFSFIFQKFNQIKPDVYNSNNNNFGNSELAKLFDSSCGGIFMTNSSGYVIYANYSYESATGLARKDIINKKIVDLGANGLLNPLITPAILETRENMTVLQKLGTGKYAVISGSPIYDSVGNPILIITCVNVITKVVAIESHHQDYNYSEFNINKRKKDQSIDIIAESQVMKALLQEVVKVARYNVTVLLLGETGVGKEVISSIIHASSKRNMEKFVKINCSAISPYLLESELFGYEAGSFTGALTKGKIGLFEVADKGTLLLDEIGDMPIDLQAKLLRVIQSHEFYRIGGVEPIKSNVRIIASTNKDLQKMIHKGEFREDLYYRLNVISIEIPPLRDRKDDIKPLLMHFIYIFNKKYGTNKQFSSELFKILEEYHWPGNIRELQNVAERLIVLCIEDYLLPEHLYSKYKFSSLPMPKEGDIQINKLMPLQDAVASLERLLVSKAMSQCKSTRKAAELLGVSQSTIMRKLKENNINFNEDNEQYI